MTQKPMSNEESDLSELLNKLEVAGPVDEDVITEAERSLGVLFPPEYRTFLSKYGAAMGRGFMIAGLARHDPDEQPLWDDVVYYTQIKRDKDGKIGDRSDLVVISNDGMGVIFGLRTVGTHSGEVIAFGPGVDFLVANSFREFLLKQIEFGGDILDEGDASW